MRTVTIQVDEIVRETDLALLFSIDGEEVWCPKSQVEDHDEYSEGDTDVEVNVAEWWASQEGLV